MWLTLSCHLLSCLINPATFYLADSLFHTPQNHLWIEHINLQFLAKEAEIQRFKFKFMWPMGDRIKTGTLNSIHLVIFYPKFKPPLSIFILLSKRHEFKTEWCGPYTLPFAILFHNSQNKIPAVANIFISCFHLTHLPRPQDGLMQPF
jgi:hypothetical protein